jgi:Flp pilus assembly protein TadD
MPESFMVMVTSISRHLYSKRGTSIALLDAIFDPILCLWHNSADRMSGQNAPSYRILVARFTSSGQWDRALETAREWLSVEPESIEAHLAAGQALVVLNRHAEAESHIAQVLTARPGSDTCHRLMSAIHFSAGRHKAADESIRKAISLDPTDAFHWYHLALMCYRQGDRASAKKFGAKALELSPRSPDIMNLVTLCEPATSANADQRLAQYHEALELDPENSAIHNNIGAHHLDITKDYAAAEEYFRRALFFEPSDKTARANLFTTMKHRDPIYRALRAPKDFLVQGFSLAQKARQRSILLYILMVPVWIFAFRFLAVGLLLWCLFIWPLLKAYEYLTMGDILSKAGEVGAHRGGFLGYRRWPLKVRLGVFASFLALFWGGTVLLWTRKDLLMASEGSQIVIGVCIVFGITALTLMMILRMAQRNLIKSAAREREKKFATLLNPHQAKRPWWQFWQSRTNSQ